MPYFVTATEGKIVEKVLVFADYEDARAAFIDTVSEYTDVTEWVDADFANALQKGRVILKHNAIQLI